MIQPHSIVVLATLAVACFAAGRWTASTGVGSSDLSSGAYAGRRSEAYTSSQAGSERPINSTPRTTSELLRALADNESGPRSAAADDALERLLRELAASSPRLAMLRAQRTSGELGQRLIDSVLDIWAQDDPESAWWWACTAEQGAVDPRKTVLKAASARHPDVSLRHARDWAASQPALTREIYSSLLSGWLHAGDYGSAARLLDDVRLSAEDRAALAGPVASNWAAYQPREAAQWALQQPEGLREVALTAVNDAWSDSDAQSAVQFISTLPDTTPRQALMQIAVSRWLAVDQSGATSWLAAAGRRREYDEAIAAYATADDLVRGNSQAALSWAERITDDGLRLESLRRILVVLRTYDFSSADSYVRNAGSLSSEERSGLLQILDSQ